MKKKCICMGLAVVSLLLPLFAQEEGGSLAQEIKITKRVKVSDAERERMANATNEIVNNPAVDVFTITSEVQDPAPKRFGSAPRFGGYAAWNTYRFNNIWSSGGNFEPRVFRQVGRVEPSSKYPSSEDGIGGENIGFFGVYPPPYFEGGELRLYRKNGLYYELIHKTKVKKFELDPNGRAVAGDPNRLQDGWIRFEDKGPVPQEGDHYIITKEFLNLPPVLRKNPKAAICGMHNKTYGLLSMEGASTYSLDDSTFAPEGGSTASLRVDLKAGVRNGLRHSYIRDEKYWLTYRPGKEYVCEMWVKASDPVTLTVEFGSYGKESVSVGDQWENIKIPVPSFEPDPGGDQLTLYTDSACTLWLDNYIIYEKGTEPFAIFDDYVDLHKEWKAEDLRFMSYLRFNRGTLETILDEGFAMKQVLDPKKGKENQFVGLGLTSLLKFCKDVGANPWININYQTKEESLALMEYLAGDTSTPYGSIRAKYGQVEPWTEVFSEITIEVGNECWNRNYAPMYFDKHEYAALCNRIFRDMKSSPYYQKDRFLLAAGGFRVAWSETMIEEAVEADMTCPATYIGGWDGLTLVGQSDEAFFQGQLLYSPHVDERRMDAVREAITTFGREPGESENPMVVGIYEFGPGYAIPNAGQPYIPESEQVGKSLALGVATLDLAMHWIDIGYKGPLCYFNTGHGPNWTSHSMPPESRPHAMWQTLALRNQYCDGALMRVEEIDVKRISIPDQIALKMHKAPNFQERLLEGRENIAMSKCYAFKDGKTHSILLFSRNVSEARETRLVLPFDPQAEAVVYEVSADSPSANNIDEMQVKTTKKEITDFSREYTFTLPPHSARVFVVQEK